ncbi:MAG TPA: TIGR03790 family protein [Verrucomicrobiae bacterium]|nr:TIGR03790 family protein [Verrucomicrobiae bacterium]
MQKLYRQLGIMAAVCLMVLFPSNQTLAGGGPLNTVIIVNANSTNSLELGNYYREQRQIPPQNVVRIQWTGGNTTWSLDQFRAVLLLPLQAALAERQLSNQVHYVVLSMDIPFHVVSGTMVNSTTAALFYGFKGPTELKTAGSAYAFSESPFELGRTAFRANWLTTMLTAGTLDQAKALVDRGVRADATFPSAPVVLAKTTDALRNLRHRTFDAAIFSSMIDGRGSIFRTNSNAFPAIRPLRGWQSGLTTFSAPPDAFIPGAIADSMTSFGGVIFGPNGQTSLLELIHAGATASYGTVAEPSSDATKFPDPMAYFYQARGFNIAESYYQSISVPYLGLIVGDPLAAPFAKPADAQWVGLTPEQALSGTVSFGLEFVADPAHPIQQVDLFIDGQFFRTLTNLPPAAGNQLAAFMHGRHFNYAVGNNETLNSLAAGFAARVNHPQSTNLTGIRAAEFGDRVVLTRFTTNVPVRPAAPTNLRPTGGEPGSTPLETGSLSFSSIAGAADFSSAFLKPSQFRFVPSMAHGQRTFSVGGTPDAGGWLKLTIVREGGQNISIATTNQTGSATALQLATALSSAVNASPELQGTNGGVMVEEVVSGWFGAASLTLRAREPGLEPASVRVRLTGSSSLVISPAEEVALDQNVNDLLPRNHVYLTSGVSNLALTVALDTTLLTDGYHELTAVAYEGSHVRTQSRFTIPVQVKNHDFNATLSFSANTNIVAVSGQYQLNVTASSLMSGAVLTTTGGTFNTVTGQNPAAFALTGTSVGVGLHPFHALVTSVTGHRYRTPPLWIRFLPK